MGQGMPRIDAIRQIGVTEQTYYRWKKNGAIESAIGPSDNGDGRNGRATTQGAEAAPEGERAPTGSGFRSDTGQIDLEGGRNGKLLSPSRRRAYIDHVRSQMKVSERRVCRVLGQPPIHTTSSATGAC